MKRRAFLSNAIALGLAGCSFGPQPAAPVALYDFGIEPPPVSTARLRSSLALDEISSSLWLQTPAILYRLAYRDPAQLQPYSRSRWAAPPAVLVTQRLRQALAAAAPRGLTMVGEGVRSEHVLKLDLDAFEQVVDSPGAGRGVLRMDATLIDGAARGLRAQRIFAGERPCPSVDAEGAVRALSAATDAVIAQVVEWVAAETAK